MPFPLIIDEGVVRESHPGGKAPFICKCVMQGGTVMRVSVYKDTGQGLAILVEPSAGKHLHPVMLQNVQTDDVQVRVAEVVNAMRSAPQPQRP